MLGRVCLRAARDAAMTVRRWWWTGVLLLIMTVVASVLCTGMIMKGKLTRSEDVMYFVLLGIMLVQAVEITTRLVQHRKER